MPRNLRPRYNIAPTATIDVLRLDSEGRCELVPMRWGLVPFFVKTPLKEFKAATFNARMETLETAASFRTAFKKGRRCLIPASGFFEWAGPKTDRQPHYFSAADGSPVIAFAGLWERWKDRSRATSMVIMEDQMSSPHAASPRRRTLLKVL
ncbi:SOS response-associated peptidase [Methyloferula stellata]|uniref:SOS response-associated peptidase n=1 Tax=Methyloferula stellata TaxID=876270 RepID=UPI0003810B4F|nr:SOS response-associated peptidase [Methyloferula stellata]